MARHWSRPPILFVLLYGLGILIALGFPSWRFLSTGEINPALLISGVGIGLILVHALGARWEDNEYLEGIARFFTVFFAFVFFGLAGSTDGRVVVLALLLALLFSGLLAIRLKPKYFYAAVVSTFLDFVYFVLTI
jgi:hypothetical protein